jgi:N-acetylmuramoyl-L-alanine amidase
VTRDRGTWLVPVDILSRLIGPALNLHIDVRRASHLIAVGSASVAAITTRIDRVGSAARVTVDTEASIGHRVTRDGNRVVVQFDASAIDASTVAGSAPEFVASTRVDGSSFVIELGPATQTVRTTSDGGRLILDLAPASAPSTASTPAPSRQPPAQVVAPDLQASTGIRTVILDPGHGGDDIGVKGPGGTLEKDVTLQLARRIKAAIESRLGIRVILTRDGDDAVATDKRTAFSNNARGDLFISLHANASVRAGAHGAEVLWLDLDQYRARGAAIGEGERVPVVGGGSRVIQTVPWELAQLPFALRSASLAASAVRHFSAQNVPLFARSSEAAPLVSLAGINMPAILIEVAFLSNPDDEKALNGSDLPNALVEAIVDTVSEARSSGTLPAPLTEKR